MIDYCFGLKSELFLRAIDSNPRIILGCLHKEEESEEETELDALPLQGLGKVTQNTISNYFSFLFYVMEL